jgi:4-alpha-glucanotransferase
MLIQDDALRGSARSQLERVGVRRFVLGVHASAFPPGSWDTGYGAPLSDAGQRLLRFAARLGFNALQVGPAGQVSTVNLSPYDGTAFARNTWSLGVRALAEDELARLLPADVIDRLGLGAVGTTRVQPHRVTHIISQVLDACCAGFQRLRTREPAHPLLREFDRFRLEQAPWLELNAACDALAERFGGDSKRVGPAVHALFGRGAPGQQGHAALREHLGPAFDRSELAQYLCHAQSASFRALARAEGLSLWGDLQVGFSERDRMLYSECFTPRWLLGAPPSRTNPEGQPWGYPVLDPDQLDSPDSPARRIFERRLRKMLSEHDGVRIDHPHGLVCPWIYRSSDQDASHAVRHGARAFESPRGPDHDLERWAIARPSDLNPRARSAFADDLVEHLDDAQVARYARLFDVLANLSDGRGGLREVFAAEVLSTSPYPLRRVLARHGLGRFRVTQKADTTDPDDVYRTDQARPEDWVMLGTHDTPPVFAVAAGWLHTRTAEARAAYLAARLIEDPAARPAAVARFASSAAELVSASFADLLASRAENVYVFVGDLLGETEPFNRAGIVHPDNWTARLPENFEDVYAQRVRDGRALDITAALTLAVTRKLPAAET